MQTLVHQDVNRIDTSLDPEHVYEQVFTQVAGQHGILDLLCVTRNRRLAILELKVTENVDLPLQAADYWSRIRWHQLQGDSARYGYFPGVEIQPTAPLVYLKSPPPCAFIPPPTCFTVIFRATWRSFASAWPKAGGVDCV
jgi:hypothetical protein